MKLVKQGVFDPNNFCIDDILDEVKKARKKQRKRRIKDLEKEIRESEESEVLKNGSFSE